MRRTFLLITTAIPAICIAFLLTVLKSSTPNFLNDSLSRRRLLYHPQSPMTSMLNISYHAPLYGCDHSRVVPDEYLVFLHFGYPLEEHKQTIRGDSDGGDLDLDAAIMNIFPENPRVHGLYYYAKMPDHGSLLAAVRKDIGVDRLECNGEVYFISEVRSEEATVEYNDDDDQDSIQV